MTALALPVPRMTRVTWYKHRAVMIGIAGAFLLAAALMFLDGILQRNWISAHHLAGCLVHPAGSGQSVCPYPALARFTNYTRTDNVILALIALSPAVVLFAGVPWVAREFESGAFRFSWTQSVSPVRSLLGTFGPLALLAEVTAAIFGSAAHWWYQVAEWRMVGEDSPWSYRPFELNPLSTASWTLLGMALALLLGVTIRRVVPAMLTFVVTFGGGMLFTKMWLENRLFTVGAVVRRASWDYSGTRFPAWNDNVVGGWFTWPNGQRMTSLPDVAYSDPDKWIARHHLTYWIAYQPASRAVWFQLARNGILIVVAALLVLAAIWWLRKRPAE